MSYTIAAGKSSNMVLSHKDHSNPDTWTQAFARDNIQKEFAGWDSR